MKPAAPTNVTNYVSVRMSRVLRMPKIIQADLNPKPLNPKPEFSPAAGGAGVGGDGGGVGVGVGVGVGLGVGDGLGDLRV